MKLNLFALNGLMAHIVLSNKDLALYQYTHIMILPCYHTHDERCRTYQLAQCQWA